MGTIKQNLANNIETGGKHDAQDLSGVIPASNVADASVSDVTSISPSIGDTIQTVSSDVSPASFGDIWYNSTLQKVRLLQFGTGSWATGGNMNTAREGSVGSGTTPAALVTMGTASGSNTAVTETYDGSSWTEVNDLNTARRRGMSSGTQTAALAFGGDGPPSSLAVNESWNGSSWTEVGDLNGGGLSG